MSKKIDIRNWINNKLQWYVFIAISHFSLSFYTDTFIFSEVTNNTRSVYLFDKIIYFIVLMIFWRFLFLAIEGWGNSFAWRMLKNTLIFLIPYIVCIIFIYPAVEFGGDMPYFINPAKEYRLNGGSLHWISTLVYILGYMAFPVEGGPTIIMAFLSALSFGYIWTKAVDYGIKRRYLSLLFLPPFIIYALYPTRLTMMTLVFMLYFTCLYIAYASDERLTYKKLAVLLLFTGMLSVWRMEGKYLLFFAPLFFLLAYKKKLTFKKYAKYLLLCLAAYTLFSIPERSKGVMLVDRLHPIVGYMIPLMEMDGVSWEDHEDYEVINGYIDMDLLKEKETSYGLELYRADYLAALDGVIRTDGATATREAYVWAAINACLQNPVEYMKIRFKVLTLTLNGSQFPFTGSLTAESIIRSNILYLLNGDRSVGIDYNKAGAWTALWRTFMSWTKNIFWQLWTTFFMMIWILIDTFRKKNWFCLSYNIGMWIFAGIVFVFCPASGFKYYWPIYTYCVLYWMFILSGSRSMKNQ